MVDLIIDDLELNEDDIELEDLSLNDNIITGGSGTSDHSLLDNLDFENSGHTGFQPAGDYVTNDELNKKGYITDNALEEKGFLTEKDLETKNYITETQLTEKNYVTSDNLPKKVSQLENDENFATIQDVETYIKESKVSIITSDMTTLEIEPNKYYQFGEVTELNITLKEPTYTTMLNEYMFEFVSGETATTLTLPNTIKWLEEPSIEKNKTYQCSIVNNVGVLLGV